MPKASVSEKESLLTLLDRGKPPFDYEKQVFARQFPRLLRIYDGKPTPPYEVEMQPSASCNLSCSWCLGNGLTRLHDRLDSPTMKKVIRSMLDFEEDGFKVDNVKFSGFCGEPLLNPSTIEGLEMCINAGRRTGLFTNGMLLDERAADGRRYLDVVANASYLHLSLDAGSQRTCETLKGRNADFYKIMSNLREVLIQRWKQRSRIPLEVGVGYIITPENYLEVCSITQKLKDLGVDFVRFKIDLTGRNPIRQIAGQVINEVGKACELETPHFRVIPVHDEDEINGVKPEIYDINRAGGVRCYTNHLWGTIGSNGFLYACDHRTHGRTPDYRDLKKVSFREAWLAKGKKLPDKDCRMCSPFGTRANQFLSQLFSLSREEIVKLHEEYSGGEK